MKKKIYLHKKSEDCDPTKEKHASVMLSRDELYELGMTLDNKLGIFFGNLSKELDSMDSKRIEEEILQRENQTCQEGANCD
tara:strand:+ start:7134 stop:7376 length:243 start_codon:yes stop_codon:yes gene_type:complete